MTTPAALVLVAYNQVSLIGAAIDGAFAQDHPDLHIVLSDDCSRDATHAVMTERATAYRGPHRVTVNRTSANAGTLAHVHAAAARAGGDLVVLAAGDDISRPDRVSTLAREWRRTGAAALWSGFGVIDGNGAPRPGEHPSQRPAYAPPWFPGRHVPLIRGATSAYARTVLDALTPPPEPLLFEDTWFTLMLAWRGLPTAYIDAPLVAYREHAASITRGHYAQRGADAVLARERTSARAAARYADVLAAFERAVATGAGVDPAWGTPGSVDTARLSRDIAFARFQSRWLDAPVTERVAWLARADAAGRRWLAPRLAGVGALAALKAVRGRAGV